MRRILVVGRRGPGLAYQATCRGEQVVSMSILPDTEIIELCLHSNGRAPLIAPFDAERVQPASYDMMLGNEFIIFDLIPFQVIDLANPPKVVGSKVNVADDEYITLMPGKFILGVTQEWLDCPINIDA